MIYTHAQVLQIAYGWFMAGLSKARIIAHRQCAKRLWLQIFRPEMANESDVASARMLLGTQVGEIARSLFPDGILIESDDLRQALVETSRIIKETVRPVFEATFQARGILVRADLLLPDAGCRRLAEVKSSTSVKEYHLVDTAIQAWVVRSSGIKLSAVEVAHINREFVYSGGGNYQDLFRYVDVTDKIRDLEQQIPEWIDAANRTLNGEEPKISPGSQCHAPFECPFLSYCTPPENHAPATYPIDILPYGGATVERLRLDGYTDLRDVPLDRLTKPIHQRIWRATKTNTPEIASEACTQVKALGYPRYYLDFETIQFAVPQWAGTRPYDQVPFQWSCHIEAEDGSMEHVAFLANGPNDPRREFVDTLIETVRNIGPVVVYNAAFERTRLRELASAFPELAPKLNNIIGRIFDLLPLARQHYYHPEMLGSWSIKAVLPTIAPELSYDGLEVANGGMAQEAFAEILHPETPQEKREQIRQNLLTYCERDTLAMVRIAHHFAQAV